MVQSIRYWIQRLQLRSPRDTLIPDSCLCVILRWLAILVCTYLPYLGASSQASAATVDRLVTQGHTNLCKRRWRRFLNVVSQFKRNIPWCIPLTCPALQCVCLWVSSETHDWATAVQWRELVGMPHHNQKAASKRWLSWKLIATGSHCHVQDKSWRVRYGISNQLYELSKALGPEISRWAL